MFRKLFTSSVVFAALSGVAMAADLPSRAPPPVYVPPPAFAWTGVYAGGEVGYQFGTLNSSFLTNPGGAFLAGIPAFNSNGVVGGAHLGINAQMSQFVVGVEADIEGAGVKGSSTAATPFGAASFSVREDVESTLRARAGYAWDRVLVYGTGGLAIADFINHYQSPLGLDSDPHTRFGWTAGGGVEFAVDNNWSVRGEYRYTTFGSTNDVLAVSSAGAAQVKWRESDNSVRVGFSYKFGAAAPPPPVVAKY
jgi:outer membrane immunogenic protein